MVKKRAPMLICIASLIIVLTIVILTACGPAGDGNDTSGGAEHTDAEPNDIDKTEQIETTDGAPGSDESAGATEPPGTESAEPVEVTVTPAEDAVSLEADETRSVALGLTPADEADMSLLTVRSADDGVASAAISYDESGAPELTIAAVGAGTTSVEVLYGGVLSAAVSVKVAEKIVVEPKPLPPVQMSDEIDPSRPMLALTFDDGPGAYTDELLDILEKYNVHVTFFVLGEKLEKRGSVVKRAIADGHEIGIHTWDHTKLTTLGKEKIRWEVTSVRDSLQKIAGYTPRLMRPPYGSTNDDVKAVAKEEGLIVVRWSVDTEDWKTRNSDATYEAIMNSAADGVIILCHDIHAETVAAMDKTIDALLREGYQLVTVSEMLSYSKNPPASGDVVKKK